MRHLALPAAALMLMSSRGPLAAQQPPAAPAVRTDAVSAPISNVRYGIAVDRADVARRILKVTMTFDVAGPAPVLLSLPVWTPGSYDVSNFAHNVEAFAPSAGTRALTWDKTSFDTWRIQPGTARTITVAFDYRADSLDNAMAWTHGDFAMFNGTNVWLYPRGRSADYPATVTVTTEPDWQVVTSMHPAGAPHTYREMNYHNLVDMPFFVGKLEVDSSIIAGKWTRFASYPVGAFSGTIRDSLERRMARVIPAESAVLGETPWDTYSVLIVVDSSYGGRASALEHTASHLGVYGTVYTLPGNDTIVASVTAHEIFHAWNVKRLRPADMVPYRYAAAEPTPWLWVSEGITDYYSDVAMARASVYDSTAFAAKVLSNIQTVDGAPPTALGDASLNTWIHPRDGSDYLYYPKGSLAGLMLDIIIRDASNNAHSLDTVMRELYRTTYKAGRGFTAADWWGAVSRAAGGKNFDEFNRRYVDGRDPYPLTQTFKLAGLRYVYDTTQVARIGISSTSDSTGDHVTSVVPAGAADRAGVQAGDLLVSVGGISTRDPAWAVQFRARYNSRPGEDLVFVVRRGGQESTLHSVVQVLPVSQGRLEFDAAASPKAVRIRNGILRGTP